MVAFMVEELKVVAHLKGGLWFVEGLALQELLCWANNADCRKSLKKVSDGMKEMSKTG